MASRLENSLRPAGFPFTEQQFQQIKQKAMADIITGQYLNTYDEWVLRGTPKEQLNQTVVLGIFPTPALTPVKYLFEPEVLVVDENHRPIAEYWKDTVALPFTKRAHEYEQRYFKDLVNYGDYILQKYLYTLIGNILPSAMMLFGRTNQSDVESAYLIAPRIVPPSAVYKHMIEQANLHLHMH